MFNTFTFLLFSVTALAFAAPTAASTTTSLVQTSDPSSLTVDIEYMTLAVVSKTRTVVPADPNYTFETPSSFPSEAVAYRIGDAAADSNSEFVTVYLGNSDISCDFDSGDDSDLDLQTALDARTASGRSISPLRLPRLYAL